MSSTDTAKPDMEAMMAEWAKYATPGPNHELFKHLAGQWTATLKMWMEPSAPPNESEGETEFTVIHGGRYLLQSHKGNWMGQVFEGMAIIGYDIFRQEYINVWIDNMGTGMMLSHGRPDESGKVINYTGKMDDPMRGRKDIPTRLVDTVVDQDTQHVVMFCTTPEGTEYKSMEITYRRKK